MHKFVQSKQGYVNVNAKDKNTIDDKKLTLTQFEV